MATKGKEQQPVFLVRKGLALVPETDADADVLSTIPYGHSVEILIKRNRSTGRMRAYWKMLHEVVEATDCAPNAERLHEVVKLGTGYVDHIKLGNGARVMIPASIAFDKMTETEMVGFFRRAEEWLARTYGWVTERGSTARSQEAA